MNRTEYSNLVKKASPPSKKASDFFCAYVIGGLICMIGQIMREILLAIGLDDIKTGIAVSSILIGVTAVLTGLNLFEKIAKHAGAGTLVPITGFANAVVSPAIEFKPEGWILGVGSRMFTIAGPVIVYGTIAGVIYGIIYWITTII